MKMIEIKGIAFPNKGAEILMNSCLREIHSRGYEAVLEPYSPYHYKKKYPLYIKTSIVKFGINILYPLSVMPKFARLRLGLVAPKEVDLILDASGFAYGKPWKTSLIYERLLNRSNKAPIVLLPQSFGTFENLFSRYSLGKIGRRVAKIYARERQGAENLYEIFEKKISIVPDITFGFSVEPHKTKSDVLIIPNYQVSQLHGERYIRCLEQIIRNLRNSDRQVRLMNHEGHKDARICDLVRKNLMLEGTEVEILCPATGQEAKSFIASSNFVITSRYHGLIGALSQNIPCIPIGWSYKYDAAMELMKIKYDPDKVLDPTYIVKCIESSEYTGMFSSKNYNEQLKFIKTQISNMWDDIFEIIE
jgi:polysaccharide pyruvyl transferase WcaK-like protein